MQQKRIQLSKIVFVFLVVLGCQQEKKLPFLGPKEIGKQGDTLYHKIPDFKFLNQDSLWISEKDMAGKIYVADFFFTTCPTICPKMKTQLLRIYDKFAEDDRIRILSHTIDPEFDGVLVLKDYAKKLNITSPRWNLLTGKKSDIYRLVEKVIWLLLKKMQMRLADLFTAGLSFWSIKTDMCEAFMMEQKKRMSII